MAFVDIIFYIAVKMSVTWSINPPTPSWVIFETSILAVLHRPAPVHQHRRTTSFNHTLKSYSCVLNLLGYFCILCTTLYAVQSLCLMQDDFYLSPSFFYIPPLLRLISPSFIPYTPILLLLLLLPCLLPLSSLPTRFPPLKHFFFN